MKLLVFLYHFVLSGLLPALIGFLLFDGGARYVFLSLWVLCWSMAYIYLDKVILFLLGAREIIDQDSQKFFQHLKSETYKKFASLPKVYLYPGSALKCFVLESRGQWTVVIDRRLMKEMKRQQEGAFAKYLVNYSQNKLAWRLTKSYGLSALTLAINHFIWTRIFFLKEASNTYKVVNFFSLALLKPFVEGFLVAGKTSAKMEAEASLEPIINVGRDMDNSLNYNEFLFANLKEEVDAKDLLVKRLEQYPALEKAVVKRQY